MHEPPMIFDSATALGTVVSLGTAFVLGSMIGIERQLRQRNAGLRTLTLVAVGAAAFVHLGSRLLEAEGEIRIIAYVVSGIGFLGAGVIMKEGAQIRGLNTAATLWSTAAVGAFAGAGLLVESAIVAAFVLGSNTLLRPLVNAINRRPISAGETEALYQVHVLCAPETVSVARDVLYEELERAHYPVRQIEILSDGDDIVELAAALVPTSAQPGDLDAIIEALCRHDGIASATWTVSTMV